VAIIYSAQVNTKLAQGDLQGARSAAHTAAVWCWVSGIIGFLLTFGWIALMIVVEAGGY
jgi:hypothetical protein